MWRDPTGIVDEDRSELRKPLYLKGQAGMQVEADGPALRVRQPARAALLFPLARVARVVSSGAVVWDYQALLLCADMGTPVVFLRRDGSVRGYFFGSDRRSQDSNDLLYTRLRARLTRPGGMTRYNAWREAMTRASVQALGAQLGQRLDQETPHRVRQALAETRRRYAGAGAAALIEGRLRGLLAALSVEALAEARLDARRWSNLEFDLDLVGDLAELLGWALDAPVLAALEARWRREAGAPNLVEEASLLGFFEGRVPELRRLGLDELHQLRQWLEG